MLFDDLQTWSMVTSLKSFNNDFLILAVKGAAIPSPALLPMFFFPRPQVLTSDDKLFGRKTRQRLLHFELGLVDSGLGTARGFQPLFEHLDLGFGAFGVSHHRLTRRVHHPSTDTQSLAFLLSELPEVNFLDFAVNLEWKKMGKSKLE